jgi:hypothetical protein
LFGAERFSELERDYARVLAARSRNHWGEFHTEELMRRLHLSLTGAPPQGSVKPAPAELDARTQAWLRHSPQSPVAAIARACSLLLRAEALYKAGNWSEGDKLTVEARAVLEQVSGRRAGLIPTGTRRGCTWASSRAGRRPARRALTGGWSTILSTAAGWSGPR